MSDTTGLRWRKATASQGNGSCVEMAATPDGVAVRDSKNPNGGTLQFTHAEISAWLSGAKAGEFDDLG